MNDIAETIDTEKNRLKRIGIPYLYVRYTEGIPVAILEPNVFSGIVNRRNNGDQLTGYFICEDNGKWSVSFIDLEGRHMYRDKLTECKAYRWLLGYPIGTAPRYSKYKGQPPYRVRRPRKKRL